MRRLGFLIAVLSVIASTGCQMDIPFGRPSRPRAKTEQSGGIPSDDIGAPSATSDEAAPPRRFSKNGVSDAQMFPSAAPVGYNDSPRGQ
jgi:hypothetical protein